MTQRALTRATYADVLAAPEHLVAEIVDGELSLSPRPSPRHADAASVLGMDLGKNTEPLSSQFVLRPVPAILKSAMNASPSLKSILKEVKERDEGSGRLADKAKRIELRRREIEGLFDLFQKWLKPSIEEKLVEILREPYVHSDKQLGTLSEESLTLTIGASEILVVPRTGSIAGATLRVDMTRNELTLPIVLISERGWHFLIRDQITHTEPVTEASFAEVLKELLSA